MAAERASQDHAKQSEPAQQAAGGLPAAPANALPALAGGAEAGGRLLNNPLLSGRGNGPVRQALLLQLQRTQGNRATQRLLRATPPPAASAPVVQRMGAPAALSITPQEVPPARAPGLGPILSPRP